MGDDAAMVVELVRIMRRESADGFESVREAIARLSESVERLYLAHEDNAHRISVLEQSAAKRRAGMRK